MPERLVGAEPATGELQPELRFADAAGADDDGQRARQQSASQPLIEPGNTGRKSLRPVHPRQLGNGSFLGVELQRTKG